MTAPDSETFERAVRAFVDAVTFDDSGVNSRGGNGGLISPGTIRLKDECEKILIRFETMRGETK